jgi:hypothetical protein
MTYRSLKVGDRPVGFELIKRANILKERFERLDRCVTQLENDQPVTDGYCACISNTGYARDTGSGELVTNCTADFAVVQPGEVVQVPKHPSLGGPSPLTITCSEQDLVNRRDGARETLDGFADYINDLRTINKYVSEF